MTNMHMRNTRLRLIALVLFLACALGAAPRVAVAVSVQEEIDLGRKIDAQIMKENRLDPDEQAQREMNEYGQKLAKFVNRPQIPYHFKVLKDNEFNAFSIPGGYVYFTSRLWDTLRTDERIGVLGHEITHVDRRHAIDAISKQQKRQTILAVILAATKAGDIWGNVAGLAEQMYTLKYSRGDEEQADFGAVDLCQKAGYNPAGILLAMYKIKRFEDESGGAPPKIFSDHPPTKERLAYLQKLLTDRGIAVPPENVQTVNMPDRVGEVTSVAGDGIAFTSTKSLRPGDIVWVMREGWDSHYENKTAVPAARAVVTGVTGTGTTSTADFRLIPSAKTVQVAAGMGVYAPPMPALEKGVGSLMAISNQAGVGRLQFASKPAALERCLAVQAVWNKDGTKLVNDNVGYLVVTDPASQTGYVGVQRSEYSYAPMEQNSVLARFNDPDQSRWIGPIISIGKGGGTIEVRPARSLEKGKLYDVLYPSWNKDYSYEKRIVGTATLDSTSPKVVLKMTGFSGGWSISSVQNGFDVYEQKQAPK